ncbi:MAG: DUF58 domain-containing protein [Planctomycetota bacterium]|nr:MAG: DUF58 domain-containing protein [Planctomycetota bacterium]
MSTQPKLRSFLDPVVVARLASLPLLARRPMLGSVSGRHASPHRGASVEFAEYRKYVAGDDLRRLDWRAYGRSDRFYIKEFEADTNLRLMFAVDVSGSMGFGSTGITKLDYARRMAAALSYLAVGQGDAVGLALMGQGVEHEIPPRRHPAHLTTLFDALESATPSGPTSIVDVLHELAETVRQRALIVILSDLFLEPESLRSCFEHLRFRHHDVAVFHLLDPEEVQFSLGRPTRFVDLEGGPALFADPVEIADRYRQAVTEYLDKMQRIGLETEVDYRRISIDAPYDQELTNFLVDRAYRRNTR